MSKKISAARDETGIKFGNQLFERKVQGQSHNIRTDRDYPIYFTLLLMSCRIKFTGLQFFSPFQVGLMHWIVDKLPDNSILNTASWKSLIPLLYSTYPNDDMSLNISLTSSPAVRITEEKIGTTMYLDTIVNVLVGAEIVPVASISGVS